jgi:hypothetical protein
MPQSNRSNRPDTPNIPAPGGGNAYTSADVEQAFARLLVPEVLMLGHDAERLAFLAGLAAYCRQFLKPVGETAWVDREECTAANALTLWRAVGGKG